MGPFKNTPRHLIFVSDANHNSRNHANNVECGKITEEISGDVVGEKK